MEATEVDKLIGELEVGVDRLRSLYEQYFMGFEKLEPTVPRKDVDRKIHALRKEQIRNTALRFRFQMILQRYNTYQTHWQRICREIDNGTYKRHVSRAQRRFASDAPRPDGPRRSMSSSQSPPGPSSHPPRGAHGSSSSPPPPFRPQPGARVPEDLAAELAELDKEFAPPAPGQPHAPAQPAPLRSRVPPTASPAASSPALSPTAAAELAELEREFAPARAPGPPRPAPSTPASATRRDAPPNVATRPGPPAAPATTAVAGQPRAAAAPAASPTAPRTAAAPATPTPPRTAAAPAASPTAPRTAAAPSGVSSAPSGPSARPPRSSAGSPEASASPADLPELRAPARAPAGPAPLARGPEVIKPRPHAGVDLPDDRLRQLYTQFVETRRRQNESTADLAFDAVAKNLRESGARLREKHGKAVDFEVVVKDGKTFLRPIIK